ncbi:hypothetical protein EVAR_79034_1 [Eumeta japonica]|uniref:Uncharacterized protein n=1 Tax=Eumeta variegata TaxID=151549 RepID=A0A4C1XWP9_EUMVA|nr:hypothetical protein EVAR_79034_1 [Eumeta japonica]
MIVNHIAVSIRSYVRAEWKSRQGPDSDLETKMIAYLELSWSETRIRSAPWWKLSAKTGLEEPQSWDFSHRTSPLDGGYLLYFHNMRSWAIIVGAQP